MTSSSTRSASLWNQIRQESDAIRRKIVSGESRIVVCVDMLDGGFDLPELKIAAFHDIRKTLAVRRPTPESLLRLIVCGVLSVHTGGVVAGINDDRISRGAHGGGFRRDSTARSRDSDRTAPASRSGSSDDGMDLRSRAAGHPI